MKPGDLVRNKPVPPDFYHRHQVFYNVYGDWFGMVIDFIPKKPGSKYNEIHVFLISPIGMVGRRRTWLKDEEIEDDIEVLT